MSTGAPIGLDRFKTRMREQLVTELYDDGRAYEVHAPAAPRRAWRWRLVTVTAAAAVVALALVVGPSLIAPGSGTSDALAIAPQPDGTVNVTVKAQFKDVDELTARLRDHGLTVQVREVPAARPEDVGAVVGLDTVDGRGLTALQRDEPAGPESHIPSGIACDGTRKVKAVVAKLPPDATVEIQVGADVAPGAPRDELPAPDC